MTYLIGLKMAFHIFLQNGDDFNVVSNSDFIDLMKRIKLRY